MRLVIPALLFCAAALLAFAGCRRASVPPRAEPGGATAKGIIHIGGDLRRPKALDCAATPGLSFESCKCGFGVCNVKVSVVGVVLIGDRKIPGGAGDDGGDPRKDEAYLLTSPDGRHGLIKVVRLVGDDRRNNAEQLTLDDPVTLSASGQSGKLEVTIPAQTAKTFYRDGFGNVENHIRSIGGGDARYFGLTVAEIDLSTAEAVAFVQLKK